MTNMDKIIEKISKLLAIANDKGATENEAIQAALMAQKLMAKYNVELDQIDSKPEQREIVEEIYHQSGKHEMKKWKFGLSSIIAKNFRCKVYFIDGQDAVFYGYKEDAKIALQVFSFLYEVGNRFAVRYYNKCKKDGIETRGVMNTYLAGFRQGVADVLEKQCTALMIVTPQEVIESFDEMAKGFNKISGNIRINGNGQAYSAGKRDGRDIANSRSLEG